LKNSYECLHDVDHVGSLVDLFTNQCLETTMTFPRILCISSQSSTLVTVQFNNN
jgi:hypothetical protein